MNRNFGNRSDRRVVAIADRMIWALPSSSSIAVAACIDDKSLVDDELYSQLSDVEIEKANSLTDAEEKRHFVFRRCFQRLFLAEVLGSAGPLRDIRIEHRRDSPPRSADEPGLKLSFSSTGTTVLACATSHHDVGIDVEKLRSVVNPTALSKRFFTPREAQSIAKLAEDEQNNAFLHYWTAKEAGLKAIGKGIVSGLNSFVISEQDGKYVAEFTAESAKTSLWTLQYLGFLPNHIVALMHRPSN